MQRVFIDGDILPYQIGFATQITVYQLEQEGLHSSPVLLTTKKREVNKYLKHSPDLRVTEFFYAEEPIQVIQTLKLHIQNIVTGSKCDQFTVILSGKDNFRTSIATIQPYKGNRVGSIKPVHFKLIRDWLLDKPYTVVTKGEEADDMLSRAMVQGYVSATLDKDLDNTPGHHYNFNKKELYYVTEDQAIKNFYTQTLVGDKADNIPGIKGIGSKTAAKILAGATTEEELELRVLQEYEKVYEDPIGALTEVGQLLWMRRKEDEVWYPVTNTPWLASAS